MFSAHLHGAEAIDSAQQGLDRGGDDVAIDADTVAFAAVLAGDLHEGTGAGVAVLAHGDHRALLVTTHLDVDSGALQGVDRSIDRAVAFAGQDVRCAIDVDVEADALGAAMLEKVMLAVADRSLESQSFVILLLLQEQ